MHASYERGKVRRLFEGRKLRELCKGRMRGVWEGVRLWDCVWLGR